MHPSIEHSQLVQATVLTLALGVSRFTILQVLQARTAALLVFIERNRWYRNRDHEDDNANEKAVELHVVV
jgi:hypothetical protein